MRLGFDLDGTLADLQGALARMAGDLFPDGVDPEGLPRSAPPGEDGDEPPPAAAGPEPIAPHTLSAAQSSALWAAVRRRENFWETLAEIEPGALARLSQLVRERGWELIFLTSRPESAGDTAQVQSHRWLCAHGYDAPSVFVVHGSRGKIAAALHLDVVVDDRPENCLDVAVDSSARPILVWRGEAANVPGSARQLGIGTVTSMAECLDILAALKPDGSEAFGLLDGLKRLLGLRPRPSRRREAAAAPASPGRSRA